MKTNPNTDMLMDQAVAYAEQKMRELGHVPPVILGVTTGKPFVVMPDRLDDVAAKNAFANMASLACVAHGAIGVAFIAEVWAATGGDIDTPPTEAFDRQECVMISVEFIGGKMHQKLLPIIRTDAGTFFGFGEAEVIKPDSVHGRFARFLPTELPSKAIRMAAGAILKTLGLLPTKPRKSKRW